MFSDFGLAKALSARISTRARTLHWADNRFIILLRFAIFEVRSNLGREPPYEVTASALPTSGRHMHLHRLVLTEGAGLCYLPAYCHRRNKGRRGCDSLLVLTGNYSAMEGGTQAAAHD